MCFLVQYEWMATWVVRHWHGLITKENKKKNMRINSDASVYVWNLHVNLLWLYFNNAL